jgi:hypothetical protein
MDQDWRVFFSLNSDKLTTVTREELTQLSQYTFEFKNNFTLNATKINQQNNTLQQN